MATSKLDPESQTEVKVDWDVDYERFGFTPRKLRVVCVGAGFSGLTLAYKLKHERPLDFVDLTIYERNPEVGGTWFENVYPGVGWYAIVSLLGCLGRG